MPRYLDHPERDLTSSSAPLDRWLRAVLEMAAAPPEVVARHVTQARLVQAYEAGEPAWMTADEVRHRASRGRLEERADEEVAATRSAMARARRGDVSWPGRAQIEGDVAEVVREERQPRRSRERLPSPRSSAGPGSESVGGSLGVTASGKGVPRPSRGAPDTNHVEVFRRTRERFKDWSRADHMDAALLLDQAAEAADASGYRALAERYRRWHAVHWDLGGRWLSRDLEERAAARRARTSPA